MVFSYTYVRISFLDLVSVFIESLEITTSLIRLFFSINTWYNRISPWCRQVLSHVVGEDSLSQTERGVTCHQEMFT